MNNTEIFVIPMANPDGHTYSITNDRLWRKNRRNNENGTFGVDLNRNHSYQWGDHINRGSSSSPVSNIYRGPAPDSEPETRAIRDFVRKHKSEILISYHSYTQLVLYPWGYTNAPSSNPNHILIANNIARKIKEIHNKTYRAQQGIELYPTNGDLTDWSYGELGILSFTIELRPSSSPPGFKLPKDQILPNI